MNTVLLILYLIPLVAFFLFNWYLSRDFLDVPNILSYFAVLYYVGPAVTHYINPFSSQHLQGDLVSYSSELILLSFISLTFVMFYFFGSTVGKSLKGRSNLFPIPSVPDICDLRILRLLSAASTLSLIGILLPFLADSMAFVSTVYEIRNRGSISGIAYAVCVFSPYFVAGVFGINIVSREHRVSYTLVALFVVNIILMLYTGDRDLVLGPCLVVLVSWLYMKHNAGIKTFVVLMLGMIIINSGLSIARDYAFQTHTISSEKRLKTEKLLDRVTPQSYDVSLRILGERETKIFDRSAYLTGLIGIIPRAMWPGKPEHVTAGPRIKMALMDAYRPTFGWPVLPPVLSYLNGGFPIVAIIGALTGLFTMSAKKRLRNYYANPIAFALMLAISHKILSNGISETFFINYIQVVVPFIAFRVVYVTFVRRQSAFL